MILKNTSGRLALEVIELKEPRIEADSTAIFASYFKEIL